MAGGFERGGSGRKRKASQSYEGPSTRNAPHAPPFPGNERDGRFGGSSRDSTPRRPASDRRSSGRGGGNWAGGNEGRNPRNNESRGQRTPRQRSPIRNQQQQATPTVSRRNTQTPSLPATPLTAQPPMASPFVPDSKPPVPSFSTSTDFWDFVTDARIKDWSNGGEAGLLQAAQLALDENDQTKICEIFHEVIKSGVEARLNPTTCGSTLASIVRIASTNSNGVVLTSLLLSSFSPFETGDRPPDALISIIKSAGLSDAALIAGLEVPTLVALNLVPQNFSKLVTQATVRHYYKQQKYNLLREETEGYSKVMAELFSASYNPNWANCVDQTLDNIKTLIGAFELDPARVLDVLLDMFACNLVANFRFYVKLLQKSPWWPSDSSFDFSENKMDMDDGKRTADADFFEKLRTNGVEAFLQPTSSYSSYPNKGNNTAAQLMGFKFRYYQLPDVQDSTPENLVFTAALLIRVGFISIGDLYPHLGPEDEEIMKEGPAFERRMREKANKGRMNALAMAGALGDDPPPGGSFTAREKATTPKPEPKPKEKEKEKKPPLNQKITLLISLLSLGAIPEALFILGKFPFLPGPFPEIADHIHRIIHYSISPVFDPLRPPISILAGEERNVYGTVTGGLIGALKRPPTKVTLVPGAFWEPSTIHENVEYRFYWEDWTEGIPVCSNSDDVIALCDSLMKFSGIRLSRDARLLSKIARIGTADLRAVAADKAELDIRLQKWSRVIRDLLLPAASLVKSNIGVSNDVWNLLVFYPTSNRYAFYGEWQAIWNKKTPESRLRITETEKDTKDLLKRISKTNVKAMARALAKVATGAPGTVFSVALGQIEAYDNLIDVVVDAARYFTNLGYDVLTFTMLISLGNEGKSRIQGDGMATSRWFQTLSVFCGKIFRRYSTVMDPTPVIQYVANQLRRNNTVDLIILKEVITSMAGIVSETNLNETHLQALAGGDVLRNQVMASFSDRRNEARTTSKRLMKCLANAGLVDELLILIAQQRQTCVFNVPEADAHLKLLGNMFDEIHTVLAQYLDLLRFALAPADYEKQVPSIDKLCLEFGIESAVAWWISRALINQQMRAHDRKIKEAAKQSSESKEDVSMADAAEASPIGEASAAPTPEENPAEKQIFHPVLTKIAASIRPILPEHIWKDLSLPFYTTFWQLSIYDVFVPLTSYEQEVNKISQQIKKEMEVRDRDRVKASKERRQQLTSISTALEDEMKVHIRNNTAARKRLQTEKDHWFDNPDMKPEAITKAFIQHCIMPRVLLTPNDATFCAKFIRLLHAQATPKFHTLGVMEAIFGPGIASTVFMLTQREAENYGKFLQELLSELHSWHADKALYDKEAIGKNAPGFMKDGAPLDYEAFRRTLYGWHRHINDAMKICLSSKEYMQIRNAIIVLKCINVYFPAVEWIGANCIARVQNLVNSEKREDLKIAATALLGLLKRKEKSWKKTQDFQKSEPSDKSRHGEQAEDRMEIDSKKAPAPLTLTTAAAVNDTTSGRPPLSAKEIEDGEIPDSATAVSMPASLPAVPPPVAVAIAAPSITSTPANLPAKPSIPAKPLPPRPNIQPQPRSLPVDLSRSQSGRGSGRDKGRDSQRDAPRMNDSPARKPTPPRSDMPIQIGREPPRGPGYYNQAPMGGQPSNYATDSPRNRNDNWSSDRSSDNRRDGRDSRDSRDHRDSRDTRDRDSRDARPGSERLDRSDRSDMHPDRQREYRDRGRDVRDERPRSRDGPRMPPSHPASDTWNDRRSERPSPRTDSRGEGRVETLPVLPHVPLTSSTSEKSRGSDRTNERNAPEQQQVPPQERTFPIPSFDGTTISEPRQSWNQETPPRMDGRQQQPPRRHSPPRRPPRPSDSQFHGPIVAESRTPNHRLPLPDSGRRMDDAPPNTKAPPAGPRADVERDQRDRERLDRSDRGRASLGRDFQSSGSNRPPPTGPSHPDIRPVIDPNHGRLINDNGIPSAPRGGPRGHQQQPPHFVGNQRHQQNLPPRHSGPPANTWVPTGPSHGLPPMSTLPPNVIEIKPADLIPNTTDSTGPNFPKPALSPPPRPRSPVSPQIPEAVGAANIHPERLRHLTAELNHNSPTVTAGPTSSTPDPGRPSRSERPSISTRPQNKDSNPRTGPSTPQSATEREPGRLFNQQLKSIQSDIGQNASQRVSRRRGGGSSVGTPSNGPDPDLVRRGSQADLRNPNTPTGPSTGSSSLDKDRREHDREREHNREKDDGRRRDRSDRDRDRDSERDHGRSTRDRDRDRGERDRGHDSRRGSERGSDRGERSEKKERREHRHDERDKDRERDQRDGAGRDGGNGRDGNREPREARETREGSRKREREERDGRTDRVDRDKRRRQGGGGQDWSR